MAVVSLDDMTTDSLALRGRTPAPTIILAHGCFDVFHIGHVWHLLAAAKLGILFATVTSDRHIQKGDGRPVFPALSRAAVLSVIRGVRSVAIVDEDSAAPSIIAVCPDFYVKGKDFDPADPRSLKEITALKSVGGFLAILDTPKFSSTEIIERIKKGIPG